MILEISAGRNDASDTTCSPFLSLMALRIVLMIFELRVNRVTLLRLRLDKTSNGSK